MDRDRLRLLAGVIDDLDLTRLDDMEFEVAVADRKQRLPVPIPLGCRAGTATAAELGDLGLVECRKGNGLKIVFGLTLLL
jgi:hypothetical protein